MFSRNAILALGALATVATAQNGTGSYTECCDLSVPDQATQAQARQWCQAQHDTCLLLCDRRVDTNDCEVTDGQVTWDCQCYQANTPNISDFGQTVPSLMCDEWKAQCTASRPDDLDGQEFCQSFQCGERNASAYGSSSSASTTTASETSSETGSSSSSTSGGGESAPSTSETSEPTGAAAALGVGKQYGTGVVGALLFGLFGLAL